MRDDRNKWLMTALLVAGAALWGCGDEMQSASQRGQISLALQSTSASGVHYGLLADIRVDGPESFVDFTDPFEARFTRELAAGFYEVEIRGYSLVNLNTGEFEDLATLISANPAAVEVPAQGVGSLLFTFAVPGGDQVSFETGTLDIDLQVVEGLPDGTECGVDADCASGACVGGLCGGGTGGVGGGSGGTGGGVGTGGGIESLLTADINCVLPIGLSYDGPHAYVEVIVSPSSVWTPNGAVTVEFEAIATLSARLGALLLPLGTDRINIDSLLARMTVAGGTPSEIILTDGPLSLDFDANNDGFAEDLSIAISVPPVLVTNDGAASVDFSLEHFEVALSGVPLLGSVVVTSGSDGSGQIDCTISSAPVSFEVQGELGGTGGAGGTGGIGGDPALADLCRPQWAHYTGSCEPAGRYYWNGLGCSLRTGCECTGPECDNGWPSEQTCLDAYVSCHNTRCGGWAGNTCAQDEHCAYQPNWYCGAADRGAACAKIPSECPEISDPVCGCDGNDYDNPCLAAQADTGLLRWGACL